jgi:diaminopimelate epimerase
MIEFTKMCASGNDFVIIDNMSMKVDITSELVTRLCDRRIGIGADGVLIIEPSDIALFKMRIINADGSEAEMCGNGARCVAKYMYMKNVADRCMKFETLAGIIQAQVITDERMKVQLTEPTTPKLNIKLNGYPEIHYINTGVPHVVMIIQDKNIDDIDVISLGHGLRYHDMFKPHGTNVNFVSVISTYELRVRTYERGVEDETYACGTGSAASACISTLLGLTEPPVTVHTTSGETLTIYLELQANDYNKISKLFLEGDVSITFEGRINI